MAVLASELIELLQDHIALHGDESVYIYDGYGVIYKTFREQQTNRIQNHFVIECECEGED